MRSKATLLIRLRALEQALEPFAREAGQYGDAIVPRGYRPTVYLSATRMRKTAYTVGHLRRAKKVLTGVT